MTLDIAIRKAATLKPKPAPEALGFGRHFTDHIFVMDYDPAHGWHDARIVHAYIGPFTSIMNDAEIRESEIEHSIVLEGSSISNLATRIEDSLIGKNVRIYRLPVKPSAYRFMLGDNSEVGIRW